MIYVFVSYNWTVNKNSHYQLFLVISVRSQLWRDSSAWCQSHTLVTHSFHGCGQCLRSSELNTPFNQQRSKVNEILNTPTICQISRIVTNASRLDERKQFRAQRGVRYEVKLIRFHVKGMVIWQRSIYPISSTVVARGLCQQDRKTKLLKLLLLPPAFGMAMILQRPSGSQSRVVLGERATGMALAMFSPYEKCPR